MKLKDSTFAIIAEKKDSISHKWFNEIAGGILNWDIRYYYLQRNGKWDCRQFIKPDKLTIYTESEFEALLKAEQGPTATATNSITLPSNAKSDPYNKQGFLLNQAITFGCKTSTSENAQTFPAKGQGNITLEGFEPKQITISYNLALEYIAERLGVDKGILKIENGA